MRVTDFIALEHIATDLGAIHKTQALAELTSVLFRERGELVERAALDRIRARENISSTAIGGGIAVPHAAIPGMTKLICGLGLSSRRLDFTSTDGEPVQAIFLICYPPEQQTLYLNFIATLAPILREPGLVDRMLEASGGSEILALLNQQQDQALGREEEWTDPRPEAAGTGPACPEILLLARVQLWADMLDSTHSHRDELRQLIDRMKARLDPSVLMRFEQLRQQKRRPVVTVEGRACQGCFMQLPIQIAEQYRADDSRLHSCPNCHRFLYAA